MIRNRFYIAIAAWMLSLVAIVLSTLVVIGVLGGLLGKWNGEMVFGLLIGVFFVAAWGAVFQMTRAWVHDRKVHPVMAIGGPLLALLAAGLFWNAWMFYFPTAILVGYLAWFHWPWAKKNNQIGTVNV